MTVYAQGGYYERRTMVAFRADGYAVWQARGSKGPADLICVKVGQVVLVQVKSGLKSIGGEAWNELYSLAGRVGAVAVLAEWTPRHAGERGPGHAMDLRLRRITGLHTMQSHRWPNVPFVLDEVEAAASTGRAAGDEP